MRHPAMGKNYLGTFCSKPDNIFTSGNRQFASTVTHLRTGHGYFRSYLYKIPTNSVDSPHYPCWYGGSQSPEQLLLRCQLYQHKRQTIRKEIGVVHPRYLWKHLLYTNKAIQPLKSFYIIHIQLLEDGTWANCIMMRTVGRGLSELQDRELSMIWGRNI